MKEVNFNDSNFINDSIMLRDLETYSLNFMWNALLTDKENTFVTLPFRVDYKQTRINRRASLSAGI